MLHEIEKEVISLGNEPIEVLGFTTEEDLEAALLPLMKVITSEDYIAA
tara:strand:- start:231 stop:374 length:144 start_codon:yes stop_codon:yes gene_type:complete